MVAHVAVDSGLHKGVCLSHCHPATACKPHHATAQVETSHIGKRAYKVKGLTDSGAAQMKFLNKCAQRGCAIIWPCIAGWRSCYSRMLCGTKYW